MKRYGTQARRAAKGARPRAHARGWHNATKGERERENTRRRRRRTNSQVSLSDSLFLTSRRRSGESARSALSHRLEGRHLHQGPSVEWTPRPATRRLYSHRPFALFSTSVRHQCAPCCFFFYLVRKFQIHRHWIITGLFWIFSLFFGEKRRFLMDWEPLRKALRMLISRVLLTRLLFFCVLSDRPFLIGFPAGCRYSLLTLVGRRRKKKTFSSYGVITCDRVRWAPSNI